MVTCTNYNKDTRCAEFYSDSVAELTNLPTTTTAGLNELAWMPPVIAGSTVLVKTGVVYVLTGDGEWSSL